MAKAKNMESWGREAARRRYAEGGEVEINAAPTEETPIEAQPNDRAAEVDEFISRVMQDQIKKMEDD
jgi:hypothetical protein